MTPQEVRTLQRQVETLEEAVAKLNTSVEGLVEAWNTAKGMTAFIKWAASLATAAGTIYAAMHNWGPK